MMGKIKNRLAAGALLGSLSIFSLCASASVVVGSSLFSISGVGFNQNGSFNHDLASASSSDATPSSASLDQDFTGMDRTGATRTMNFVGTNQAASTYGRLHLFASGTVTNNYYNAANPKAYNGTDNYNLTTGSPDGVYSLGFTGFTDTLQYGGSLQAGYTARYIFHVDGTNSGQGALADLSFGIQGYSDESFFAFDPGFISTNWATQSYAINGITPQLVHVQFSNQFTMVNADNADGATISGASNFSSTLTLAAVEIRDANGNPVSGVTVSSDSGTVYPVNLPEPASLTLAAVAMLALKRRRRI